MIFVTNRLQLLTKGNRNLRFFYRLEKKNSLLRVFLCLKICKLQTRVFTLDRKKGIIKDTEKARKIFTNNIKFLT